MTIYYTRKEELWNTWSHAAGIMLGMCIGCIFLTMCCMVDSGSWVKWGISLYLFGMLGSYISSTIYHALPPCNKWKEQLRKWDHAAIYWHIAGSYSPLTLIAMRQESYWGIGLFIFIWACALIGTVMSFARLKEHSNLETISFIAMGISVLVAFKPLLDATDIVAVSWIIAEGVFFITGAIFYSFRRIYMHSVFHFFVLAGSICHIVAVWDVLLRELGI